MNPIKWSNESLLHFTFFIHWYLPTHLQFRWRLVLKCTGRENFSSKLSKSTSSASHCAMWLSNDFPYRYYYYESSQPPPPPFNGRQDNHYKMRKPKKNLPIFTRGKGNWKSPPIQEQQQQQRKRRRRTNLLNRKLRQNRTPSSRNFV